MSTELDNKAALEASSPDEAGSLRHSLWLVTTAWVFGAAWMFITTGAVLTSYGKLLHLSDFAFGLLAALPYAGTLAQLPTSYFIERFGHQKGLFIGAGIIHRFLWLPIALIPWVIPHAWWWLSLLLFLFLSAVFSHVSTPVWYSWMGDLVPSRIRGRYFSRRSQLGQGIGLVLALVMGKILDMSELAGSDAMLKTISVALVVGGLCGMTDFLFFFGVPAPRNHKPNPRAELWSMIRQPLMDRNFRRFMGFTATLTFATGYVGQFVWLYLFDVVKMSKTSANAMLISGPIAIMMLALPIWGRIIDRFGRKPVLVIAGLMVVNGALPWLFITRDHWWQAYIAVVVATFAWPGIELANFNILLSMSESKSGRRYGTSYIAIISVVTAMAGVLSGLFGGIVAKLLGGWQGTLFGWPLTYHGVLFIISGFLRFAALGWLINLEDGHAHSTRSTFRYLAVTLYSNLQQVVVVPVRLVINVGKLTYKLNPIKPAPGGKPLDPAAPK